MYDHHEGVCMTTMRGVYDHHEGVYDHHEGVYDHHEGCV